MLFPPVHRIAGVVVAARQNHMRRQELNPVQRLELEPRWPLLSHPVLGCIQSRPLSCWHELLCGQVVSNHLQNS